MEINPDLKSKIEPFLKLAENSLSTTLGMEFISIEKDKLVAKMPVDKRTQQPFGLLHGGASVALAETLCSVGGWLQLDGDKYAVVGQEINANHIRPVSNGFVTGTAKPLHLGRKSQVWQTEIRDENGKLVCVSRCTLSVIER